MSPTLRIFAAAACALLTRLISAASVGCDASQFSCVDDMEEEMRQASQRGSAFVQARHVTGPRHGGLAEEQIAYRRTTVLTYGSRPEDDDEVLPPTRRISISDLVEDE